MAADQAAQEAEVHPAVEAQEEEVHQVVEAWEAVPAAVFQ